MPLALRCLCLGGVASLVGCALDADYGGTAYLCAEGACPPGYLCVEGRCVGGALPADGGPSPDGAEGSDGGAADAPAGDGPAPAFDAAPIDGRPAGPNLITNPGFEDGLTSWSSFDPALIEVKATGPTFAGAKSAQVAVKELGANMQLYQYYLPVAPSTEYELRFAGQSSSGADVLVVLQRHEADPYAEYGLNQVVDLTTSWQVHTFCFTTTADAGPDARLRFWFAEHAPVGEEYRFDEVSLSATGEGGCAAPVPATP